MQSMSVINRSEMGDIVGGGGPGFWSTVWKCTKFVGKMVALPADLAYCGYVACTDGPMAGLNELTWPLSECWN